ncbi:unnamed protein product [Adineta steineri]|uniref:Uncharacterized protein n=1 Tax=Adineta steineri TaxID=433720 RepID=A0A820B1Q7_9BILA|nr:unnamed protein product [Adineta steineri]
MAEVTTTTPSLVPLTTVDNLFSITHQFFDQYRTSIAVFTGTAMTGWLYNKFWMNRKFYPTMHLIPGKTVLITSGHTGIGYETAKDLLRRGARVIITCHDMYQGNQAIRQIRSETECNEKSIRFMECDLCSLDSVRHFAKNYNNEEERLDVLICNSSLLWTTDIVTKDGFNSIIQADYLSHFLLTNLLLNKLKQCRPSRIINISSSAHKTVRTIDWSDALTQFKNYYLWGAYPTSKVFQILSAYKLKQDLFASEGINVFAVNPGWIWTSNRLSIIEAFGFYPFLIVYPILRLFKIAFGIKPKTGAQTTIYCAVDPLLEHSGDLYFEHCAVSQPSWLCTHDAFANQLWQISCEAVEV